MTVHYRPPERWIQYDIGAIAQALVDAKAAVLSLAAIPFQRSWAEKLQEIQLKREVAGTSRIEGAEFTERELDAALAAETPHAAMTRSQRQVRAAIETYRWIAGLADDRPVTEQLIRDIHRRIVTGCDDDHCEPGGLRGHGNNVTFGAPRHRGVEGGDACARAFAELAAAIGDEFRRHDILVQALALHYHIGAMHPFADGNGRTARAVEALMLQCAGLKDTLFIAMSNYYYDEKPAYLAALAECAARNHDLTPFLQFGLAGIQKQCQRLLDEIRLNVQKALFRDVMYNLFNRLRSTRKRVLAGRQIAILNELLDAPEMGIDELFERVQHQYTLKNPWKAFVRDLLYLEELETIYIHEGIVGKKNFFWILIRLDWPTKITETEFFRRIDELPKGKSFRFLR
ncbi:MAG: Fic family protein [Alphaproteobacteria bacterium]